MIHRVAPAGARQKTEMRAAQRGDAAFRFHLAETAIAGCDDDVTGKHHFDADGEADTLNRRDDRFSAALLKRESIDVSFFQLKRVLIRRRSEELRHIETGGEVASLRADHADPIVVGIVQESQGVGHLVHHLRAEGIFLGRIVDDDLQHMTVYFGPNLPHSSLCLTHVVSSRVFLNRVA